MSKHPPYHHVTSRAARGLRSLIHLQTPGDLMPPPMGTGRAEGKRHRRRGRASVVVALVIVALVAGAAAGYWLPQRMGLVNAPARVAGAADADHSAAGDDEQWYTCGMHPNVLQKGPGDCPICQMKLTPLKQDDESSDSDAGTSTERKVLYWRAPMDPNYISQKPGKSPMGMDLVPVYADKDQSASAHAIHIDPVTIQNMGIRTTTVARGPLVKTIRTVGRVDYDEQLVTFVDTKFNGWIEKLYVDETGQQVQRGDPLFDVYSPELYAAQQEYLSAVQGLPLLENSTLASAREDARKMVDAAVIKLKYMDVSSRQIESLKQTETIEKTLMIHSPASGIVTEKMALGGMYVKPGMRLFTIADLSRVWVYVDVYEYQLPWIHVGQRSAMTLPYIPGEDFIGKVVYIYPYLNEQTRVIKVRLEFENPKLELKPGMYANVKLESELQHDAILVPREAYIDSGARQVAFVDLGHGKFLPRDIQVGVEAEGGMVEVLGGLDEGEVVVTSGQFMLDAESKLKEAVAKMMEAERTRITKRTPASTATETHDHQHGATDQAASSSIPPDAKYACSMAQHPDEKDPADRGPYFSDKPGDCPRCGMALKPLDDIEWVRARRAAEGGDVAYTCPDHQHVFSETPGECPRCGKPLMPFKVMYTCPNPEHDSTISPTPGHCPLCGRGLAAYRGMWLDEKMADANVPAHPELADAAQYRCPLHPLVHSDTPGRCTICGGELEPTGPVSSDEADRTTIPPGSKYTCTMKTCWHFSAEPGECPNCGMRLKPIEDVGWAKELLARQSKTSTPTYVCPMHPDLERSSTPGVCSICGMPLVRESALHRPETACEHVIMQMDYVMEHYLELQRLLSSDRTTGLALQALGLVSASEALAKRMSDPGAKLPPVAIETANRLRTAALKITGKLDADRVTFVELSAAVSELVEYVRPDSTRWPKLYLYHCPMSKGDWLQTAKEKANPYYGFKMLNCGELKGVK